VNATREAKEKNERTKDLAAGVFACAVASGFFSGGADLGARTADAVVMLAPTSKPVPPTLDSSAVV